MHEVWASSSDGVMHEVLPTAQVYVRAGVVGDFSSDYLNEIGHRVPIIGQIYMNGNVEYLGITEFYGTGGPFWVDNILDPCSSWRDGGTTTNKNG